MADDKAGGDMGWGQFAWIGNIGAMVLVSIVFWILISDLRERGREDRDLLKEQLKNMHDAQQAEWGKARKAREEIKKELQSIP